MAQAPNIDGATLQRSNSGSYPDNQIVRVRSQPKLSVLAAQLRAAVICKPIETTLLLGVPKLIVK